jgi:hypothetical protein
LAPIDLRRQFTLLWKEPKSKANLYASGLPEGSSVGKTRGEGGLKHRYGLRISSRRIMSPTAPLLSINDKCPPSMEKMEVYPQRRQKRGSPKY